MSIKTYKGIWFYPTVFITEDNTKLTVYAYSIDMKELKQLMPFECYIQLEGNQVRNYVYVK